MVPKAEATRQRVIEVAAELMGRQGYGRTGLEAILDQSGVSKGNFYHHFPSKEDLGLAVLDFLGDAIEDRLRRRMAAHQDPLDRVDALLEGLVAGASERDCRGGCPLGNLAAEMSDLHEGFRERLDAIFARWRDLLRRNLQAAGAGRPLDIDGLARHAVCALEGSILLAKVTRRVDEMDNSVEHLKSYLRKILREEPAVLRERAAPADLN